MLLNMNQNTCQLTKTSKDLHAQGMILRDPSVAKHSRSLPNWHCCWFAVVAPFKAKSWLVKVVIFTLVYIAAFEQCSLHTQAVGMINLT